MKNLLAASLLFSFCIVGFVSHAQNIESPSLQMGSDLSFGKTEEPEITAPQYSIIEQRIQLNS